MPKLAAAFLLMMFSAAVFATDVPLRGVWNGTLGKQPIVACFNGDTSSPSGSYYYLRHLIPIPLRQTSPGRDWYEQNSTGIWTLNKPNGTALTGQWQKPDKSATLAIALTLIAGSEQNESCASDAYNHRLEVFPKLIVGEVKHFQGKRYRTLRIADEETIELLEPGQAVTLINKQLRNDLPRKKDDLQGYFETRRRFLGQMGLAAEDETTTEPTFWNALWISVRHWRDTAGEGARGTVWGHRTWSLKTGEQIELWSWFDPAAKISSGIYGSAQSLPHKLQDFLFKFAGINEATIEPDCKDHYESDAGYELTLETEGMKFSQRPDGSGCEVEIAVPYNELLPVMTSAGKAAVRELMALQDKGKK